MHALAEKEIRPRSELLLQRTPHKVREEHLVDARRRAVRRKPAVPCLQERDRPPAPLVLWGKRNDQRHQLFRRERQLVHLHRLEVLSGMLLLLLQQLDDALLAEAVGVLDAQEMRVVIVRDLVVRAGDPVRLRVVGMWKLLERDEARPVVVFGPAGRRHRPVPLTPHRHEPGELIADIAVDICVREVQRWKRPLAQRLAELFPVVRRHYHHHRLHLVRRLQRNGLQRKRPWLSFDRRADDRPVARHQHLLDDLLGTLPHGDFFAKHFAARPLPVLAVARCVRRVDLLDEQVVAVHERGRHAPGDPFVVAHDHRRQPRQPHASRLHLRRVDVHLPPDRGQRERQVGVAR